MDNYKAEDFAKEAALIRDEGYIDTTEGDGEQNLILAALDFAAKASAEPSDEMILRFMDTLHSNVPQEDRPMAMSDFSEEQLARIRKAFATLTAPSLISDEGIRAIEDAAKASAEKVDALMIVEDAGTKAVAATRAHGGYLPAIATLFRLKADELADRFPDDTNGGLAASPSPAEPPAEEVRAGAEPVAWRGRYGGAWKLLDGSTGPSDEDRAACLARWPDFIAEPLYTEAALTTAAAEARRKARDA